ncbi:MAG TPA: DUF5684 domain-containing protein [Anaerohalosphaeraceae bacterium]|nr:DUF5684 domain-containing protein [Anaerohalosphaeraceae bacterium]
MVHFQCPHCKIPLQMGREYVGQTVLCPHCHGQIQVPRPADSTRNIICLCSRCNGLYRVPPAQLGRQVHCPTCKQPASIPAEKGIASETDSFRFNCPSCGQDYCLPSKYAGGKLTCLACKQPLPIPRPSKPDEELVLLEEKTLPEEQPNDLQSFQSEAPVPEQESPEKSPAAGRKLLAVSVIIIIGLLIRISVYFWTNQTQKLPQPTPSKTSQSPIQEAPPAQNYPQAVDFSRSIITRLNRQSDDVMDIIYLFPDTVDVSKQTILALINSLDIGRFFSVETQIEKARVEPGASFFITKTTVSSELGKIRTIRLGFVEIENPSDTGSPSIDRWIFGLAVFDENEMLLASAGETDLNALTAALNEMVTQYAHSVPSSLSHRKDAKEISRQIKGLLDTYYRPIATVLLLIFLVTLISMRVVFDKAGEPGWAIFVPIYNTIVLARIGGNPEWLGLVCALSPLVPAIGSAINLILFIYLSIGVAKAFGKGTLFGLGLVFLPFIFYPILAFSKGGVEYSG